MTCKPRTPPAVQLARDVLHAAKCRDLDCQRCYQVHRSDRPLPQERLARALLRAVRKERP